MKTLFLPVCLFAAVAASAAELKDPAAVASDWANTVIEASAAIAATAQTGQMSAPLPSFWSEAPWSSDSDRTFRSPPSEHLPEQKKLNPDRPRQRGPKGAKPYEFNGETYWLVPLAIPEQVS